MSLRLAPSILFACFLAAGPLASAVPAGTAEPAYGVLVMAHGGSPSWNATVRAAVAPLAAELPVEIAFGMADAASLHEAVMALEARGVGRIGVVRLFISGDSWLERTERILGLAPGAAPYDPGAAGSRDHAGDHATTIYRVPTSASFALSTEGLADAPESELVLADRASGLSANPALESVLILAHGVGTAEANAAWESLIADRAAGALGAMGFQRVIVETLAEDWPELRAAAETRIRASVEHVTATGGEVIVLPFRLAGFGPYAEVLAGLRYVADGQGLLPHPAITDWIRRQARELQSASFRWPLPETVETATREGTAQPRS